MSSDLDKLQGAWHVTFLEVDGAALPAGSFDRSTLVLNKREFTSSGMGATYGGTVELDETVTPKTVDLLFAIGPEKGNRNRGIYRLDGDRWTLCLATRGDSRPTMFATQPDTGHALQTLERGGLKAKARPTEKMVAYAPLTPVVPTDVSVLEGGWQMVSAVFNGDPLDHGMAKLCTRTMQGDITTVMAGPQVVLQARFVLNDADDPRGIDYMNLAGANLGKHQAGIFELEGGTLRLCMAAPGDARPADFSSTRGDRRSLSIWTASDAVSPS